MYIRGLTEETLKHTYRIKSHNKRSGSHTLSTRLSVRYRFLLAMAAHQAEAEDSSCFALLFVSFNTVLKRVQSDLI